MHKGETIQDTPGETMAREGISNFRFEVSAGVSHRFHVSLLVSEIQFARTVT